ncbi:MAG: hypothetical protein HRU12_24770 [Phaeodactylibacter sp.]|nr:hypothetical protein [Phaeodactylibacter sp.]
MTERRRKRKSNLSELGGAMETFAVKKNIAIEQDGKVVQIKAKKEPIYENLDGKGDKQIFKGYEYLSTVEMTFEQAKPFIKNGALEPL